jgi:hypothetical protein
MENTNTTIGELHQQYPELTQEEIIMFVPPEPEVAQMTLGPVRIDNVEDIPVLIDEDQHIFLNELNEGGGIGETDAGIGGVRVDAVDESWEIAIFDFEINSSDDVYTVGAVLVIFMLIYAAKQGVDHWFNKRLEIFKKKLDSKD